MFLSLRKSTVNGVSSYQINNRAIVEPDYFAELDRLFYQPFFYLYQLDDKQKQKQEEQQHYNPNTILQHLKNISEKTQEEDEKAIAKEEQEIYQKCVQAAKEKQKLIYHKIKTSDVIKEKLQKAGFQIKQLTDEIEISW